MENISTEFSSVYIVIVITSIFGILLSGIWAFLNKKKIGYIIAPFLLFVNVFLYAIALKLEMLSHHQNELWEGIIVLYSLFMSISLIFVMPPTTSMILKKGEDKRHDYNGN